MRTLRDLYYLLFYFWFRFDLLTRRRENRELKALGAVTIVQVWLVLGGYWWGELLVGFPSPSRAAFLATVFALLAGNWAILRRRGWEDFERRFALLPSRARWAWMAVAGGTSLAAFALLLSAAIVARSGP